VSGYWIPEKAFYSLLAQVIALESAMIIKSAGGRVLDSPRKLLVSSSNYYGSDLFPTLTFFRYLQRWQNGLLV